ncbi:MAG: GNAT family N-acetyltransferase [Prevotella sp.]|nr:GNAT family N-acetyltransferase [Prevotella sp.]
MIEVRRYTSSDAEAWDDFVGRSKNGTFLFKRGYMDYHADRFSDHSLLIFHRGRLMGLLPANADGTTIYSHQGLTYGGLVTDHQATTAVVQQMFGCINDYYREQGFGQMVYKALPWMYHDFPAEEALYALFSVCKAQLMRRDVATVTTLPCRYPFVESRKSGLRKASAAHLKVEESNDLETFWHILDDNLTTHHNTHPVHSLQELQLLASRFPKNIRLFMAFEEQTAVGGVLLYFTPQVVHTQYISATERGKQTGAVDMIFHHILNEVPLNARYFDFGTSVLGADSHLNEPLIFQKEGFGGRAVCYDTYSWKL